VRGKTVVDKNVIAAKLTDLADRVERVRSRAPESQQVLEAERDTLDIVAFNLMLAVQTCTDIASHIISDEGWPAARTLGEGFDRLAEHAVLSPSVATAMQRAAGFRNVVAHGYAGIDVALCYRAATNSLTDLDAFAREVSKWTNERA
jgi:uncharacterized protein YutE (UPF0331/DUF86 family)